jgi:hypothetical protein
VHRAILTGGEAVEFGGRFREGGRSSGRRGGGVSRRNVLAVLLAISGCGNGRRKVCSAVEWVLKRATALWRTLVEEKGTDVVDCSLTLALVRGEGSAELAGVGGILGGAEVGRRGRRIVKVDEALRGRRKRSVGRKEREKREESAHSGTGSSTPSTLSAAQKRDCCC